MTTDTEVLWRGTLEVEGQEQYVRVLFNLDVDSSPDGVEWKRVSQDRPLAHKAYRMALVKLSRNMSPPPDLRACSFCGAAVTTKRSIIAGNNGGYICRECVDLARDIFDECTDEEL